MNAIQQVPALARFSRNLLKTRLATWSDFRRDPVPILLIWESNNRCNARCAYCDFWREGPGEEEILREPEVRDLIDQTASLGVCCFSISGGGDPLLREDLGRNIVYAKAKGLTVAVTTNGLRIDDRTLPHLRRADVVTVSLDSLDPAVNRRRRGVQDYQERCLAGIRRLAGNGGNTYICVQAVVDEENWREMNEINDYFYALGVDTLFQPRYHHTFHIPRDEWRQRAGKLRYHNGLTRRLLKGFTEVFPEIADGSWRGTCLAGSVAFVVTSTGEVRACHLRRDGSWNLRETSLAAVWKDMRSVRRTLRAPDERDCTCGDTAILPYSMLLA